MKKRKAKIYILLVCALVCALMSLFISRQNYYTTQELTKLAETRLQQKEVAAKEKLFFLAKQLRTHTAKELFSLYESGVNEHFNEEGISFYIYENDSLRFWTDNEPSVDLYAYSNETNIQLISIRNGWYEYIKQTDSIDKNYTAIALITIKSEYDIENKYLDNNFSSWLGLPENTKLVYPINYLKHTVKSKFGSPIFQIYRSEGLYKDKSVNAYACFFALVAIVLILLVLFYSLKLKIRNKGAFILQFAFVCFVIRTLMIFFKFPGIFYDTNLFNPGIFANADSFYFGYLGDVLINSILIFTLSVFIYKTKYEISRHSSWVNYTVYTIGLATVVYFSYNIRFLIFSLVNNSTITYNINELFNLSGYSFIGLTSVGMLMFAFYLLVEKTVFIILRNERITQILKYIFFICVIVFMVVLQVSDLSPIDYLWPAPFVIVAYLFRKYRATYNFINIGLIILMSTLVVSHLFSKYEGINKQQNFDALSLSLTDRQDIIAENEFTKISNFIKTDVKIKNLLSLLPLSAEQLERNLRQINFSGYFERYEITLALFKNDCTPVFKNNDPVYSNEDYFLTQIENDGSQTMCDDLYFIDKDKKSIRYVAKIDIEDINKIPDRTFKLYVQFEPKLANNIGAFPDLLLDKSLQSKLESKQVSYAIYQSGKLQTSYGEFQYPFFIDWNETKVIGGEETYKHFTYPNNKQSSLIIISDKKIGVWQRFTSNSYLFIYFSFLVLICIVYNSTVINRSNRFNSLNSRIQFIFVSIVVISLAGVVIGTIWIVSTQFETNNKKDLISKSQSVLKELQQTIGNQDQLDFTYRDYTALSLKKLSQLFGSDISLFNRRGILFATSQPALYEQGLISKFMHPDAYSSFAKKFNPNYSHKERIGKLNYLSAYIPFYSKNQKLLGYINLPYFSRQKDLEKELTAYLTTLINIYTILFAITTLVALFVSNLLTKPLRIIKQQISKIQFGKTNEPLQWNSTDEIGNLVTEYNNMLVKLEKSTELLAQSERENAWREMAKQVAHEIKNPLTPMKLHIQHLQRVAETNPKDMNERVIKLADMLIEQIDTLSHIATEFSSFAKLPKANLEILNVLDVLQNVTDLFQQNTNCEVKLYATEQLYINADREQCLRVFTNLLKNAEQAIPEDRKGKIEVVAFENEGWVRVNVKDNGCGVPENIQQKLFTPNFTTKSTGTGLGLAMVKNIILSFNGTITFVTEENVGTIFTVSFPLVRLDKKEEE